MIERIVENWLTRSGERSYETPFTQVLAIEGHRILQGPVHHAYEHGKDVITLDPAGAVCAFQLKGGAGSMAIAEFEAVQAQLFALVTTAVTHPAVSPARRPDRAFFVTNRVLTAPVRDRIEKFNLANQHAGYPPLEPIERDQLIGRFVQAHGRYLPLEPRDFARFLELFLNDGHGPLPRRAFAKLLADLLPEKQEPPSKTEVARAAASAALITAYATAPWQRSDVHLAQAEASLLLAANTLRLAAQYELDEGDWKVTYELALEAARRALTALLAEALAEDDLVIPDLADAIAYGPRALLVCGYLGALCISEAIQGSSEHLERVKSLIRREFKFARTPGEAGAPSLFSAAWALELAGETDAAANMVYSWARELAAVNQPKSDHAIPDPYHELHDVLLKRLTHRPDQLPEEQYAGHAYTLHIAVDWLARRSLRGHLDTFWPDVTRIALCEFQPTPPHRYLSAYDPDGQLSMWHTPTPESWRNLQTTARQLQRDVLPAILWKHKEFIPYVGLIFPYRFTAAIAKAIDHMVAGRCELA